MFKKKDHPFPLHETQIDKQTVIYNFLSIRVG